MTHEGTFRDYGFDVTPLIFEWDRQGRKGQVCRMLIRGKLNSCLLEFVDGFKMVVSRNSVRRLFPKVLREPKGGERKPPQPTNQLHFWGAGERIC